MHSEGGFQSSIARQPTTPKDTSSQSSRRAVSNDDRFGSDATYSNICGDIDHGKSAQGGDIHRPCTGSKELF